jgi:hypothetical protein
MRIQISQRQPDGSMKKVIFEGKVVEDTFQEDLHALENFLLDAEVVMNHTGEIRVIFDGDPVFDSTEKSIS